MLTFKTNPDVSEKGELSLNRLLASVANLEDFEVKLELVSCCVGIADGQDLSFELLAIDVGRQRHKDACLVETEASLIVVGPDEVLDVLIDSDCSVECSCWATSTWDAHVWLTATCSVIATFVEELLDTVTVSIEDEGQFIVDLTGGITSVISYLWFEDGITVWLLIWNQSRAVETAV